MFWRFGGYANISSLDSLLDKPDVTVEEVLDESDTLGELKGQNAKLIDFLREDHVLEKLLAYTVAQAKATSPTSVTSTPEKSSGPGGFLVKAITKGRSKSRGHDDEPDKAEKQRMKYAYISAEILSSDVWSLSESILESTDLLRPFWNFLKTDAPMDNVLAGYFTKINEALIEKQPARMVSFVRTLDDMIPNMMKHVDCPMVMDLLLKLISLEKDVGGQGIVDWIQSQGLIPILLSFISPDHTAATQTAAGDFLKAIITISANATGTDQTVIGPNELTRELVSEKCISALLTEMLKGGNSLTVGVGIVIEVIRKNNSDYDAESQIGPEPKSSDPIYLGNLLRLFAHAVPKFMDILHSPNHTVMTEKGGKSVHRADLKVAWGKKIEPLGFDRFKTCELMAELLHCSNMALLNERGTEEDVKKRDAEREKLKAEGRLASATHEPNSADEFGRSVDSSGFHHAEAFSPLGESPEKIKNFDMQMQNNSNDEDGFEKVALDDADPDFEEANKHDYPEHEEAGMLSEKIDDMNLNEETSQNTDAASSHNSATGALAADSATPAPLFARRNTSEQTSDAPSPFTQANINLGIKTDEPSNEDSQVGPDDEPGPEIQTEDDGTPVLGDLLKMQFTEHHVVPTILDFFFRFPWNNFLHNVVYDVVQQVFNGAMDRGYNRNVATDLFETGRITDRVIEGQERSDQSQKEQKMRLGYMGHLTLIAEEIVKFTERQPPETLAAPILDKIMAQRWIDYVENVLSETRERDNAILGGVRPDPSGGPRQAVLNAVNAGPNSFANAGSQALADAGLGGDHLPLDSMDLAAAGAAPGYNLNQSAMFNSDEEDEEDGEGRELIEHAAEPIGELTAEPDEEEQIDLDADPSLAPNAEDRLQSSSTVPLPLAVPPAGSSARRRLASILAEKKRQADINPSDELSDDDSLDEDAMNLDDPSTTTTKPAPLRAATKKSKVIKKRRSSVRFSDDSDTAGNVDGSTTRGGRNNAVAGMTSNAGFADDFQGFSADDDGEGYENERGEDGDEDEDEPNVNGHMDILHTLRKMSTRRSIPRRESGGLKLNASQDSSAAQADDAPPPSSQPIGTQVSESTNTESISAPAVGSTRQATSEATSRRPLSSDDSDVSTDDDEDSPLSTKLGGDAAEKLEALKKTTTEQVSKSLSAPLAAAGVASTSRRASGSGAAGGSGASSASEARRASGSGMGLGISSQGGGEGEDDEAAHARRKKEDQQKMLEAWGLGGEEESEDSEDEPLEIKRTSSRDSTGSGGSRRSLG